MAAPHIEIQQDKSYSASIRNQRIFRGIICILLCIMSVFPFYLLFVNATRASDAIKTGISLLPSSFFARNWASLMEQQNGMEITIWGAMLNSFIITAPATIFTVYFSAMTAYGVYVYDFKAKNFVWGFIMAIMMVPAQISIIGFYQFMVKLHLNNTYVPLIIPAIAAPSTVFFMRQYMQSALSLEIIEAARIDGAGEFRTFNTIVMPLMKPAVATQAIFAFIANWNNLFTPSIMLSGQEKATMPMFVQLLTSDQFRVNYGVLYMGLFITIVPIVIVYSLLSRYIIAGVALGGVKE